MTEHRPPTLSRRRLLSGAGKAAAAGLLAPALAAPLLSRPAFAATGATAGGILKVGDQRSTIRSLLEASGQLKDIPYTLEFADFPAAPPMLEALNAGAIDAGFAGDAAHAFALPNGLPARIISAARSDPVDPDTDGSLDAHGNPNMVTPDTGTSALAQGCSAQSALVEVERFTGPLPPIRAFQPPRFVGRP